MKPTLSVVVLTHNDESRIVDCLECLGFANELIVIDDESSDRTLELVRNFTEKIYIRALKNNFSNQRNFALNYVHSNWVFFVDSDELVSAALRDEILSTIRNQEYTGYYIKRFDYVWETKLKHGELSEVKLLRLAKKDAGKWHGRVHEIWNVKGKVGELSHALLHVPHQNVREFVKDVDEYSNLRVEELLEKQINVSFVQIILFPVGKFLRNYLIRQGYRDGVAGFIYSIMMSFHSFLVRSKLYLRNHE